MIKELSQINDIIIIYLSVMYYDLANTYYLKQDKSNALYYYYEAHNYLEEQRKRIKKDPLNNNLIKTTEEKLLSVKDKITELSHNSENSKFEKGKFFNAIEHYKNILCTDSTQEDAYYNLGSCLFFLEAYPSALFFFEETMRLNPKNVEVYKFVGDIYMQHLKEPTKAIHYFQKYLNERKDDYNILMKLGFAYIDEGLYETLETQAEIFKKASEIKPDSCEALIFLGQAYIRLQKYKEFKECTHKLFELRNDDGDYFHYGCDNIQFGNFEEGWEYYEYRFSKKEKPTDYPHFDKPRWEGEKITGKTLLVQAEQGFGDAISFFRYLPELKNYADKVIYRVYSNLSELFNNSTYGIEIVKGSTPLEELSFDYHVPLMSLPYLLKGKVDNIPLSEGYIKADKNKAETYRQKYFDNDCFKIGICWEGSKIGNKSRNIPLEKFYPLTKLENVKIYSFQKGDEERIKNIPTDIEIVDLGKEFTNFNDTAAAMDNLDLFITSDNGVANLAGAMGKKTFLLLNLYSEWRWFFDTKTTPWYDSFTIFKKHNECDDWSLLMQQVIEEILQNKI